MTDSAESYSPTGLFDSWELHGSVRVNERGYDIYHNRRTGNYFTREVIPGGVCDGHHGNVEALALLAELAKLAKTAHD